MRPGNGAPREAGNDAGRSSLDNQHSYFAGAVPRGQELDDERSHFASLRAQLCQTGYSLSELACDGYVIARWNLTRNASDLRAVGAFLRQIGGTA